MASKVGDFNVALLESTEFSICDFLSSCFVLCKLHLGHNIVT